MGPTLKEHITGFHPWKMKDIHGIGNTIMHQEQNNSLWCYCWPRRHLEASSRASDVGEIGGLRLLKQNNQIIW